jgi:hypothetical protein
VRWDYQVSTGWDYPVNTKIKEIEYLKSEMELHGKYGCIS